jgi:hypothetical protein
MYNQAITTHFADKYAHFAYYYHKCKTNRDLWLFLAGNFTS